MARKQTLSALLDRRKKLDEEIEAVRKEELAAVSRWVLNKTGCVTMAELKAAGWSLSKKPPADGGNDEEGKDETATGDGVQNGHDEEPEIKAFAPPQPWN